MAELTPSQIKARDFVLRYNEDIGSLAPDWHSRENQHAILILSTFMDAQQADLLLKVQHEVDVACSDYHAGFYGPVKTRPERRIAAVDGGRDRIMELLRG